MYDNIHYLGMTLKEWREVFHNTFTLGELYRMMQEGANFKKMATFGVDWS